MTIDSDSAQFSRSLKSAILLPIGVIFLTALALLFLVFWLLRDVTWSNHSFEVLAHTSACENLVSDSQNNIRGYLLTGDHAFVDSFDQDHAQTDTELEQLKNLVQDNREQVNNAEDIIQTNKTWFQIGQTMIAHRAQNSAVNPDWVEMGKTLMGGVKSKFDKFSKAEELLQEQRLESVRQMKTVLGYAGGGLFVLLSLSVAQVVRRQFMILKGDYRTALATIEQRHAALVRSEADLEEQKEWFRVTLKSIGDGVIVTDQEGRVVFMNHESERLTGWNSVEALLKPLPLVFNIINEMTRATVEDPVARVFREKKVIGLANHTILVSRLGEEWPIEDSAAPIRDSSGRVLGVVLVFHNATEMRRTQNTLAAYSKDLEKKVDERTLALREMVTELEAFSYTISHDLRSPLRAMQGFAEAILEDYADKLDDRGKSYLDRIKNAAERLDRLIQDLLAYTRISRQDTSLVPLDLDKIVREIIEYYPNLHPPAAQVEVAGTLPKVWGLEASLTQVIANLLGNAAKFVAKGKTPHIKVWGEDRGAKVRVWVQDNGIGIASRDFDRIFQMFVQVNESQLYGGTGVGLAIVQKAVRAMHGSVGLESEEGKGSKFWVELTKVS